MEPVTDLNHFSDLIRGVKTGEQKLVSNCYLLPSEIIEVTQARKLLWEINDCGIFFLCEKLDFFYLYFFLIENRLPQLTTNFKNLNKPVIIDFVYSNSNKAQAFFYLEEKWKESGFSFYKRYRQMSREISSNETSSLLEDERIIGDEKFIITYGQPSYASQIQNLWRQSLDILSMSLPGENDLLIFLENKQIFCVLNKRNQVVAAFQLQQFGKVGMIKHVAVHERYRRLGLAKAMLQTSFSINKNIKKYTLWVDENNISAVTFYLNFGFCFTDKESSQLFLKSESI